TPIARPYEISVLYFPRRFYFEGVVIENRRITVRVLSLPICLDPRGTGERPRHIYLDDDGIGFSLCLYDPRENQWSPEDFIADTILPWTSEWLYFFEGWMLTDRWEGGGNHPMPRKTIDVLRKARPSPLRRNYPWTSGSAELAG